jgi:hypothetical protein
MGLGLDREDLAVDVVSLVRLKTGIRCGRYQNDDSTQTADQELEDEGEIHRLRLPRPSHDHSTNDSTFKAGLALTICEASDWIVNTGIRRISKVVPSSSFIWVLRSFNS